MATQTPPHPSLKFALAVALLWCPAVLGDTLVLTNGDKLTGEIKKLEKGKLSVKLAYSDDPLVLDWTVVASVTTEKPLKVILEDGSEISAKLQPAKESGRFLAAGDTTPVELKSVVKAEPARPPPKGFEDRFATDNSITYDYVGGSAFETFIWYTNTAYYADKWEPLLLVEQNFNGARALRTNTASWAAVSVNYYLTEHIFLYPWLAGEKLRLVDAGYGSSVQAGGGVGWAFRRSKQHRLLLQGGFVADRETLSLSPPNMNPSLPNLKSSNTFPAGMLAFNWRYSPNDNVTLKTRFVYYRSLDSNVRNPSQLGSNVEVDIPIYGPVSLTFQSQDYANPLGTVSFSKRTLNLSSGFEISY